tara:strand:- start:251 stop:565 length:315 start_codon:yes stop_codon:yes gene_type:complete
MIVEYEFEIIDSENLMESRTAVPKFITNGGYFRKDEHPNRTFVGFASDSTNLPENAKVLDRASLITRLTNIGYTVRDPDSDEDRLATAEEIETAVDHFISKHDI